LIDTSQLSSKIPCQPMIVIANWGAALPNFTVKEWVQSLPQNLVKVLEALGSYSTAKPFLIASIPWPHQERWLKRFPQDSTVRNVTSTFAPGFGFRGGTADKFERERR